MSKHTDMRSTKSEVAKTKYCVIGLFAVFGLAVGVIDTALDHFFFYEETFWKLLITDVPKMEIYIRSAFLVCFFVFGIIMAEVIARRKRAEELFREANQQLLASEQQLKVANRQLGASQKKIMELAKFPGENPNPVLRIGKEGTVLYSNEAAMPLLTAWGAEANQRLPEKWCKFTADVFGSGSNKDTEFEYGDRIFSLTFAPVVDLGYVNVYALNITERRRAEQQIENLAKFPGENPNPVLRITKDGEVLYSNEAGKPLLAKWKSDVGKAVPQKWRKLIAEAFESKKGKEEEEEVKGKIYSLSIATTKEAEYVNLYARDITEIKKAEEEANKHREEFLHVSRLSTVGEMASGLAHELNQPLCAILTHGNVCLRTCENDIKDIDKFKENLKIITSQSKRAGEIINRIKDFVRKRAPKHKKININHIIRETVSFLSPLIKKNNIRLDLKLNAQRPFVLADPIQIEQVLINLACNAIESMQKVNTRKHRLILKTSIHSDNLLEIAISDTGKGLSQDIEKLSKPFFTTKKDGLGIGLSISHSIIEAHGGTLCARTNPDYGCTFKVTLPVGNVNDKTIACELES